ncbi:MAG: hypothetical protein BWZ08_02730 [candidate division BRC1 bacterium ADurb.BinA292]|nr:MAG: hypothetical protein BWZ08_02730 [candidate division BRC1 bacterium ADurb.BinA292]
MTAPTPLPVGSGRTPCTAKVVVDSSGSLLSMVTVARCVPGRVGWYRMTNGEEAPAGTGLGAGCSVTRN